MKIIRNILLSIIVLNIGAKAQILECRAIEDMRIGVQLAKYKFEKLKSANGTIYEKGGYNYKHNYTYFSAVTKLGIEKIFLFNESKYIDDVEMFRAITSTSFKNGMEKEIEMLCYDLKEMNKKRIREGNKPSPITVSDY